MASRSPSPKTFPESSSPDGLLSISPSSELPHIPSEQTGSFHGPVTILWDIENCPVPSDVRPEDVAGNIRMALRVHPVIKGAVTMFSAYGDFNAFPRRLREGCQRTGVKLVDVPNGRKDAADKAILVDMFLFALDNRPPSSILLISGDVDFAPALHILGQRGYTIILVIPAGVGVSSALSNAGRFVWDWPSVARGEGFVHPKTYMPCGPEMGGYLMSCNYGDNPDSQNDEEAIVYRGTSQSEYNSRAEIKQICCYNSSHTSREFSKASHFVSEYSGNSFVPGPYVSSSRSQSLPSSYSEAPIGNQNSAQGWWVQPGDVQGLKGQLVRLLEMAGGSLPLVRVPPEYLKTFGRPLYMSEYGVYKLVNLIKKMEDTFVVVGKGHKKLLCLRNSSDKNIRKCPSTPIILRRDKKGKGVTEENVDIGICANMGSSSDDSEDERIAGFDERLLSFRQEVQELLVCCCWVVPLDEFKSLYEQRYKKSLDYQNFGVTGLEELIEKLRDVVVLREDLGSNKKVLFSSCVSG